MKYNAAGAVKMTFVNPASGARVTDSRYARAWCRRGTRESILQRDALTRGVKNAPRELHSKLRDSRNHTREGEEMPTRTASAVWEGGLKGGKGNFKGETGLGGTYSFGSRFESGSGSNPEELLAAAEAACYSMALSGALEKNGTPATRVETKAACTVDRVGEGFKITNMKLTVRATVPGVDEPSFRKAAEATKDGCPVSQALKGNVKLELDARLERQPTAV
jgi:lipoyl-dependent peroxiredoxin